MSKGNTSIGQSSIVFECCFPSFVMPDMILDESDIMLLDELEASAVVEKTSEPSKSEINGKKSVVAKSTNPTSKFTTFEDGLENNGHARKKRRFKPLKQKSNPCTSTQIAVVHAKSEQASTSNFAANTPEILKYNETPPDVPNVSILINGAAMQEPNLCETTLGRMTSSTKTFVFLDLEATGLHLPKVTEICLVAVHFSSLENPVTDTYGKLKLPRILDKLCLCVDPGKPIDGIAAEITGLSNTSLGKNEKQDFNSCLVNIINEFLNRQVQPVCLVAHNGFHYDFPLLKTELQKQESGLSSSLLCMDTLKVFRFLNQQSGRIGEKGYSLSAIYRRAFKEDPKDAHNAEGDVLTLIMIFLSKANQILETMPTNCKRWGEINPMKG